ncbi:La protein 4 [Trichuris trichiura]|uniref:La protein 4 n=1 Tax=Trichuris trichiura TaxID=36087 RepID=A0A077Z6U8_TRITR|nr:La protein 4 [Trichuris trichiura]
MIDEAGSYYICTETSPRCFIIQKVSAKNIERLCSELGNAQLEENGAAAGGAAIGDGSGAIKENDEELQAQQGCGGSPSLSAVERVECVPQPHLLPLWFNTECEEQLSSMNGGGDGSGGASTVIDQSGCVFSTLPATAAAGVGRDSSSVGGGGDSSPKNGGCYYAMGAQATPQSFVQNKALAGAGGGRPAAAAPIDACISLPAAFADHVNITIAQNDDTVCRAVPIPVGAASPSQSAAGTLVVGALPEQCVKLGVGDYASGSGVGVSEELSRDELKFRLRTQLEYYFSRENLASDTYLRSQMDNDQYVPIRILANFNMVKKLSGDLDLIIEALRESPYVQVDESGEKVRPVSKRSTLILRDVPDGTEKSEVIALFNSDQCPKLLSCECALQNSWYANFESDDDAERAYIYLRDVVKTFKDKPILARFKTASIARVPNGYGTRPVPVSMTYMAPNFAIFNGSPAVGTINAIAPVENFAYTAPVNGPPMQPFVTLAPAMEAIPADASAQIGAPANFAQPKVVYYTPAPSQPAPTFLPVPQAATTPFVAAAATAAMFGSTWPPFDLGQILAMNGFQPQGTFRPAVAILSAPPVAPVPSRRFPDRIRKRFSDGGGRSNYYGVGDRTPFGGNELRTPMTHHRFGHMGPRGYNDGRPYFRHHDQSVQYNGIRHRGVRQDVRYSGSSHRRGGGGGGGGGGMRDGGGRYSGADYWASGSSSGHAKERRSGGGGGGGAAGHGPSTSGNSGSAVVEKKPQSFDFQPSNFPPLPTADDGAHSSSVASQETGKCLSVGLDEASSVDVALVVPGAQQEATTTDSVQCNLLKDDQKQENERSQQATTAAPSVASANSPSSLPTIVATTMSPSSLSAATGQKQQKVTAAAEPAVSSSFSLPEDAAQAESKLSGRSQSAASAALKGGDKRAEGGGGGKEATSAVAQCPTPRSSGTAWSQVVSGGPPKRGNDKATEGGESSEAQPKATERKRVTYADMAKLRGGDSSSSIRSGNIGKSCAGESTAPLMKSGSNENGVLHGDRENPSVNAASQAARGAGAAPLNRATVGGGRVVKEGGGARK